MSHRIKLQVKGPFACFTRPEMKAERVSYDVMTPSAAVGILESIHWKPAIRWVIDEIAVLKPIRFTTIRRNEVGEVGSSVQARSAMKSGVLNDLSLVASDPRVRVQRTSLILADVAYVISAHFELTSKAGASDSANKHIEMFERRAQRGQCFRQPCLGNQEFHADFELLNYGADVAALPVSRDLGFMLWGIDYKSPTKRPLFFRATMQDGKISIPQPGSTGVLA